MEGYRWNLRVRTTDRGTVRVIARKNQFEVGAPVDFDEEATEVSALECALGALGAELAGGFKRLAERARLQVDHVEATVQGELNDPLLAIGVVGAKGNPRLERIHVKVYVSSTESETELDGLWQKTLETSPLLGTLRASTRVEVEMQVVL